MELTAIPDGWELGVISPDGEIVVSIDIEGYNLRRPMASNDIGTQVMEAIEWHIDNS